MNAANLASILTVMPVLVMAGERLDWYYSKTEPRWLGVVRRFIGWLMD
jgi:hypothetical protein